MFLILQDEPEYEGDYPEDLNHPVSISDYLFFINVIIFSGNSCTLKDSN